MTDHSDTVDEDGAYLRAVESYIEKEEGPHRDVYIGRREHLIAEGVATEDMFPVWPKRTKWNLGPDIPCEENWDIKYMKGGRYRVGRHHEYRSPPIPPPKWNPDLYLSSLLYGVDALKAYILSAARGEAELKKYGRVVHRIAEKDVKRLEAHLERLADAIVDINVKPHLQLVQGGMQS